jgi:hypothetical protein
MMKSVSPIIGTKFTRQQVKLWAKLVEYVGVAGKQ